MTVRAVFMGSPAFAVPSLHASARTTDLRLVVTQPDRPAGRGRKLVAPAIKPEGERLGVEVLQPTRMRDGTLAARLRDLAPDVIVVVAFGRILPPDVLAIPPLGCVNVHASLLPRWRGAAPIQRAVLAGDPRTGVSLMRLDQGLDTGPVHETVATDVGPEETAGELSERLAELGAAALERFLGRLPAVGEPVAQPDQGVTLAPPLRKEEGEVEFSRTAREVIDHVRGMDPWPGAYTFRGEEPLRLFGARPGAAAADRTGLEPGRVNAVHDRGIEIETADGTVCIGEVQPPGRPRMPAPAYARGRKFAPGERLGRIRA